MRILMVCLGNICRSPLAQGALEAAAADAGLDLTVDSAGTSNWHVGSPPDPRAIAVAQSRGLSIEAQRARQVEAGDFTRFDLVCAMDSDNLAALRALAPPGAPARLALLLDFAPLAVLRGIPDPYHDGPEGFDAVLDLIEQGVAGLVAALLAERDAP